MSLHHITTREKLIVMLAIMSGLFLVALDQTIIATALSGIVKEFNSFSSLGFIVTAYMLTSTVTVPLAGKLSDMYGRRPILLLGVITFTIGSFLSGNAHSMTELIAFRALQGVGGGMIMANAFTIVGDLFPPRERSKWQGLVGATFGLSSVVGPLLGGWLTDSHQLFGLTTNWRWNFFINVPIGLIASVVIFRFCPTIKHETKHKPDYFGALLISLALATIVLAVDNTDMTFKHFIDQGTSLSTVKIILLTISAVASAAFVWVESKASHPILPLRFFKNKVYTHMTAVALMFGAAFLGSILYLTQFNQQVFGADATKAGLMLLPMVIGMMISSISTGQVVSRLGYYKPFIMTGLSLGAGSIFLLTTMTPSTPYWHEAVIMAITGLGLGMTMPILTLAVQNEFEQKDLGAATASVQLFRGLGSTVGVALLSGILTAGIVSSMGNPSQLPYIQTLAKSPQASQMLSGDLNSDVLLSINSQKTSIKAQASASIDKNPKLPAATKQAAIKQFTADQDSFGQKLIQAFTNSLHHVFILSSALLALALASLTPMKRRKLRNNMQLGISE